MGVDQKLIITVKQMSTVTKARITIRDNLSGKIKIIKGLKQGCNYHKYYLISI
jgi:hypothetical protein